MGRSVVGACVLYFVPLAGFSLFGVGSLVAVNFVRYPTDQFPDVSSPAHITQHHPYHG
jgi:hypothetical protein